MAIADRMVTLVRVETNGHQLYKMVEGELVAWTTTVVRVDQGRQWVQVAAILLKPNDSDEVRLIPLVNEFSESKVTILGEFYRTLRAQGKKA